MCWSTDPVLGSTHWFECGFFFSLQCQLLRGLKSGSQGFLEDLFCNKKAVEELFWTLMCLFSLMAQCINEACTLQQFSYFFWESYLLTFLCVNLFTEMTENDSVCVVIVLRLHVALSPREPCHTLRHLPVYWILYWNPTLRKMYRWEVSALMDAQYLVVWRWQIHILKQNVTWNYTVNNDT